MVGMVVIYLILFFLTDDIYLILEWGIYVNSDHSIPLLFHAFFYSKRTI